MREFLLSISIVMAMLIGRAEAQDRGIEAVIGAQIEAFQADDFARAFTYASPNIQGIFGTPERFGMMVRRGYPMVHRPSDFRFLEQREISGMIWQKMMFWDQDGRIHMLDYQMVNGESGWKINAVQMLPEPDPSA